MTKLEEQNVLQYTKWHSEMSTVRVCGSLGAHFRPQGQCTFATKIAKLETYLLLIYLPPLFSQQPLPFKAYYKINSTRKFCFVISRYIDKEMPMAVA